MAEVTTLETVLKALLALVKAALPAATVLRNADRPEKVPPGGLAVLNDGANAGAEAMFSPLRYMLTHRAELVLAAASETARAALIRAVAVALGADRTLGGLVEWCEVQPPAFDLAETEGAKAGHSASLDLEVWFLAADMAA